jgi:sugar phosphate isomerase/epimerase
MILNRRRFLALAAGAAVLPRGLAARPEADPAYAGFQMGIQTYSLRAFDFERVLEIMKDLGLKNAQFFGGRQMQVTDDKAKLDGWKEKLKAAGISILSFGVQGFGKDAEANRKSFEFAKAMGFPCFTANPSPESFENLAVLTKEYGVTIAIHNHGPEDKRYGKLEQVQKAVEKWPEAIGVCVDTGHVLRIGEDPVKWIRELGPRVHDVHLKDASGPNAFHVVGKGKLDTVGVLKALKDVKFKGCLALEYELNEKDPVADIQQCLAATREACGKL